MDKNNPSAELNETKRMNKKLIIIIIVAVALLLTAGGVVIYSVTTDTPIGELVEMLKEEKPDKVLVLDEFLVNALSEYGKTDQVLRINIALTHVNDDETGMVEKSKPIIRDIILANLSDLKVEKLLEENTLPEFKTKTKDAINEYFQGETFDGETIEGDIITGLYVTDLIVR